MVKTDFDYSQSDNHRILFGLGTIFHLFNPGKNNYNMSNPELNRELDTSFTNPVIYANEPFLYFEDEINSLQKLKINAGIRLSGSFSKSETYFNVEPRLSANYSVLPRLIFKAGYSRMVQYLHLLSTSGVTMPTDIWVPALKGLKPLKSDQIDAGISFKWNDKILFSVEVYRKWFINTTDFKSGTSLLTNLSPWYEKTTQGKGNAKGIEVSVEKQYGKLTGSINYTLSTASRKYADLNNGHSFPFRYDRPNDLNIFINYKISERLDISAIWLYGTGYPVTVPIEKYSPALGTIPGAICYYPSINNYRLDAYHRLDLSIHFRTKNRLGENILSFDIFNAYNRKNPINMYFWQNYSFQNVYLLPIIPSINYILKFK